MFRARASWQLRLYVWGRMGWIGLGLFYCLACARPTRSVFCSQTLNCCARGGCCVATACRTTDRIGVSCLRCATVVLSDIQRCKLDCLDFDAFDFPGAASVTTVNIQHNNFLALPETLLWNMTSLQEFHSQHLVKLGTLPERFFWAKSQLKKLYLVGSVNLGSQERLPDNLFKGLTSLIEIDLVDCSLHRLPNVDDLKVCGVSWSVDVNVSSLYVSVENTRVHRTSVYRWAHSVKRCTRSLFNRMVLSTVPQHGLELCNVGTVDIEGCEHGLPHGHRGRRERVGDQI